MSELTPNHFTPVTLSDSRKSSVPEFRDLTEFPELLVLLQEIKNKFRLTPDDYPMLFAELKAGLPGLGISEFDQEINFLSMLFNMIFVDQELPDGIKAQLARLQINLLISVMQESGFLDHSSNPARRLLDTVVRTEIDLINSGKSEQSGIEILKKGINKIINCEIVDYESYRQLLEQYQNDTETGINSEASVEQPAQTPSENPEDTKTTQIVLSMMQEITLPLEAQYKSTLLFDKVWGPMLLQIALTEGLNSSTWIKKVQTVKTQAWALTPKTTDYDHQKLITMIPHVSRSLVRAMNYLDLPAELQTSLKEHLEQEQAKVIKSTEINVMPLRRSPEAESRPKLAKHNNEEVIAEAKRIIKEPDASPSTTNLDACAPDDQRQEASNTARDDETVASEADKLKVGDWIEIDHEDSEVLVKLIWRSEDTSMFIFVDREGNRLREVDGATLDQEIATGQVKVTHAKTGSLDKSRLSFFNILKS